MSASRFVQVDVEPGPAAEEGKQARWKRSDGGRAREVSIVPYETESGLDGAFRVVAIDTEDDPGRGPIAYEVEDSSDGTVWLIVGGRQGLRLTHATTGVVVHEPYLLLALHTVLG